MNNYEKTTIALKKDVPEKWVVVEAGEPMAVGDKYITKVNSTIMAFKLPGQYAGRPIPDNWDNCIIIRPKHSVSLQVDEPNYGHIQKQITGILNKPRRE